MEIFHAVSNKKSSDDSDIKDDKAKKQKATNFSRNSYMVFSKYIYQISKSMGKKNIKSGYFPLLFLGNYLQN